MILARNFDFEAGPIFDDKKALFLDPRGGENPVRVGVVAGARRRGQRDERRGRRARRSRRPRAEAARRWRAGRPHDARRPRRRARRPRRPSRSSAIDRPMVSHMVMIVDPSGDVAIVERAPGAEAFVRRGKEKVALTNHLEGPLAGDPANQTRRGRHLDLAAAKAPRRAPRRAPPGRVDRRRDRASSATRRASAASTSRSAIVARIDALIATHAVVLDATARVALGERGPAPRRPLRELRRGQAPRAGLRTRGGRAARDRAGRPDPGRAAPTTRG